jgi:fatty acid desaturase
MSAENAVTPAGPRSDGHYAELLRRLRQGGLLDRRPGYYTLRITGNVLLMAVGWGAFVLVGRSWWQLLVAAYLAVIFTQTGFLGHDAGHRQIAGSRRVNDLLGQLHGNLGIGLAFGWWVNKHHRHHAHPNQEGHDPDISNEVIVFTKGYSRHLRGLRRARARHQAALFFPLLLLEGLALHVASVRALCSPRYRHRAREAVLLCAHAVAYLTAVLLVLLPLQALLFVAVHQGLFGLYLGSSFAPNHKGMPILTERDHSSFLRRQVLTSRNVRGGPLIDLTLGGLNYQIEHHLFPSMPRPSLRHAQPIVRAFCQQHGLTYTQTTLIDSYRQALRHLETVGRDTTSAASNPKSNVG